MCSKACFFRSDCFSKMIPQFAKSQEKVYDDTVGLSSDKVNGTYFSHDEFEHSCVGEGGYWVF